MFSIFDLHKETVNQSKNLNSENRLFFQDMSMFLRTSNVSQKSAEETLVEIVDHLLLAQETGKTAIDVFGKSPKEYCEELVDSLPKAKSYTKMLFFGSLYILMLSILLFFGGLLGLLESKYGFHAKGLLFNGYDGIVSLILSFIVYGYVHYAKRFTFRPNRNLLFTIWTFMLLISLTAILLAFTLYASMMHLSSYPLFAISPSVSFALGFLGIVLINLLWHYIPHHKKK